jgi:hypothetical protein
VEVINELEGVNHGPASNKVCTQMRIRVVFGRKWKLLTSLKASTIALHEKGS